MNTDPYVPETAEVDHQGQSKLAVQMASMRAAALLLAVPLSTDHGKHRRSGITKNKSRKRNKVRVRMARESRKRNR